MANCTAPPWHAEPGLVDLRRERPSPLGDPVTKRTYAARAECWSDRQTLLLRTCGSPFGAHGCILPRDQTTDLVYQRSAKTPCLPFQDQSIWRWCQTVVFRNRIAVLGQEWRPYLYRVDYRQDDLGRGLRNDLINGQLRMLGQIMRIMYVQPKGR